VPLSRIHTLALDRGGRRAVLVRNYPARNRPDNEDGPGPDLTVWDVDRGTVLRREQWGRKEGVFRAWIAPEGNVVVVCRRLNPNDPGTFQLYDTDGRQKPKALPLPDSLPRTAQVLASGVEFSPNGRYLAAFLAPANVVVWDLARGGAASVFNLPERRGNAHLSWGPRGEWLVVASTGSPFRNSPLGPIRLLDPSTGTVRATMEQPLAAVDGGGQVLTTLACSPDRRRVAALVRFPGGTGTAGPEWEVHVWDARTGKRVLTSSLVLDGRPGGWDTAATLTFSADGRSLTLRELLAVSRPFFSPGSRRMQVKAELSWRVQTLGARPVKGPTS
jgi:WD40 repeat protein